MFGLESTNSPLGDRRKFGIARLFLGLLTFGLYAWFTLMPDNHSYMVGFPWVYLVQVGFLGGSLWAIAEIWGGQDGEQRGLRWLGGGLDWGIFCLVATLTFSLLGTQFTEQAFLYSLIDFAYIGIWFGLQHFFTGSKPSTKNGDRPLLREPLIIAQGILAVGFILASLGFWLGDTVLPEFARLENLQRLGITESFNFSSINLRNWATFGHPNYVAGFLLLALPLLLSLAIAGRGWVRWAWLTGFAVGLIDFYSTNSRGGWLGLFVACVGMGGVLLWRSQIPRRWLILAGGSSFTFLIIWAANNDRLRRTFTGLFTLGQQGGEFAYRWITIYTGWRMGLDQPLTGQGLGSTAYVYQNFRPHWAGLEAEILFQLHSTPIQIWAELGFLGIATMILGLFLISRMWWQLVTVENIRDIQEIPQADRVLIYGIGAAGLGYGVMATTDYQLDVVAIAGFLVLYLALLTTLYHRYVQPSENLKPIFQPLVLGMVGLILASALVWLLPTNQAYVYAQKGFQALRQNDLEVFAENLSQAHNKAPWQPYYAYQLGWTLGELARTNQDKPDVARSLNEEAILWFQKAIAVVPDYEFGQSSLGWLTLKDTPTAATRYFSQAADLMPYHRLNLVGLGESWLKQGETAKAIEAIACEWIRFPELLTSPQWRTAQWLDLYTPILTRTNDILGELLKNPSLDQPLFQEWLHRTRGMLRWYAGDDRGALADFEAINDQLGQLLSALGNSTAVTGKQALTTEQRQFLDTAIEQNQKWALAIAAWLDPTQAETLLIQALNQTRQRPDPALLQGLLTSARTATTFREWWQNQPLLTPNRVNRVGFNVVLRHVGGNKPSDFGVFYDNFLATTFFGEFFTTLRYAPDLDLALEPYWQSVLNFEAATPPTDVLD